MSNESRNLYVAQQFTDRSIRPVGRLTLNAAPGRPRFEFVYLQSARSIDGFRPYVSFPDFSQTYVSNDLFPFFENRVMARGRPEYEASLAALDLSVDAEPFEILSRNGGHRATDEIELFPEPERDTHGNATCLFFARGIRYVQGAEETISELHVGDQLFLHPDPENKNDSTAVKLVTQAGSVAGWVPRYFTRFVSEALMACPPNKVRVEVRRVGQKGSSRHSRLLVRLSCCWLDAPWPFTAPEFAPVNSNQPEAVPVP